MCITVNVLLCGVGWLFSKYTYICEGTDFFGAVSSGVFSGECH